MSHLPFYLKAIFAFLLVSAFGIAWALFKHEMGKEGERMDEFLRMAALVWFYGRWIALAIFALSIFWWGKGLLP